VLHFIPLAFGHIYSTIYNLFWIGLYDLIQRHVKTTLTMCMNGYEDGFATKVAKWEAFSFCFHVFHEHEYEKKHDNKIIYK